MTTSPTAIRLAKLSDIDDAITEFSADTTNVHGIADTSALATKAYADGAITTTATALGGQITAAQAAADAAQSDVDDLTASTTAALATKANMANGKLRHSELPMIGSNGEQTWVVDSQAQMLALANAARGDVAFRTDTSTYYILTGLNAALLASWTALTGPRYPAGIASQWRSAAPTSSLDVGPRIVTSANEGNVTFSTAGEVVIGREFANVTVTAANVTFIDCVAQQIHNSPGVHFEVWFCELRRLASAPSDQPVIREDEYTLAYSHVHDYGDGPRIDGDNVVIHHNYFERGLRHFLQTELAHTDGVQWTAGNNAAICYNTFEGASVGAEVITTMNAPYFIQAANGPCTNIVIKGNRHPGLQSSLIIYVEAINSQPVPTGVLFEDNEFEVTNNVNGVFGFKGYQPGNVTWRNNWSTRQGHRFREIMPTSGIGHGISLPWSGRSRVRCANNPVVADITGTLDAAFTGMPLRNWTRAYSKTATAFTNVDHMLMAAWNGSTATANSRSFAWSITSDGKMRWRHQALAAAGSGLVDRSTTGSVLPLLHPFRPETLRVTVRFFNDGADKCGISFRRLDGLRVSTNAKWEDIWANATYWEYLEPEIVFTTTNNRIIAPTATGLGMGGRSDENYGNGECFQGVFIHGYLVVDGVVVASPSPRRVTVTGIQDPPGFTDAQGNNWVIDAGTDTFPRYQSNWTWDGVPGQSLGAGVN